MRLIFAICLLLTTSHLIAQKKERVEAYDYFQSRISQTITVEEKGFRIDSLLVDETLDGQLLLRTVFLSADTELYVIKMVSDDPRQTSLLGLMMNSNYQNIRSILVDQKSDLSLFDN